jgi:hypothetical protein
MLITSSDFIGRYKISSNPHTSGDLNAFLLENEKNILKDLLGSELCGLLEADLTSGVPQSDRFTDIYNELYFDYCGREVRSRGMKSMLVSLCFFLYVRQQDIRNTISGDQKNTSSNSIDSPKSRTNLTMIYNDGVSDYHVIQHYIKDNEGIYPEFKGIPKRRASLI